MILHTRTGVRRGITLLEVLTAIFIMGVGLLAILVLFPLGALSMAKAVREDRAAAAGANAASMATAMDLRNDPLLVGTSAAPGPLLTAPGGFLPPDPNGPGYPVLVDPLYRQFGSASIGTTGVRRSSAAVVALEPAARQPRAIARWFTFQEEITFERSGEATGSINGGGSVTRPGTYSWTYLVRRPRSSSPALTELAVIVYASRATDAPAGETVCTAAVLGTNSLQVNYVNDKPNVRKGGWIMDATYTNNGTYGSVNGHFYQVAAVSDTSTTSMTLELETPLKGSTTTTVVLLDNVITVLDRGTSWRP